MRTLLLYCLAVALGASAEAQDPVNAGRPPSVNPCGQGTLTVTIGGAASGEERYNVECAADGSMRARGTSKLSFGGMSADYETAMELSPGAIPSRVTAVGTSSSGALNDTLVLQGAATTLTRNGAVQPIAAAEGAAYVGNNLFWPLVFVLARHDPMKEGAQRIPIFPTMTASVAYAGADTVSASGTTTEPARVYHRYSLTIGPASAVAWTDDRGRMAAIVVAAARLLVSDTRDAAYIAGLATAAGAGSALGLRPPDYSAPADAPFTAHEVTVPANGYTLAGTLLLPKGGSEPFPAALTITGSGQQTRDSAIPIPGLERYAPFREIAERLAARGIAVLRVDDRGVGGSTGASTLATATSSSFADDVRAQLRFLRSRDDIDGARIALIGHSEGALIAPMVASGDSTVAAVVLMAGGATTGDSVLFEQMEEALARDTTLSEADKAAARQQQRDMLRRLAAGEPVPELSGGAWFREYVTTDPAPLLAQVRQPVLVLHGEHDRQLLVRHARRIADVLERSGNADVTLRIFPTLNHLFLPSATGAFSEYGSLESQTLPDDVLTALADWLSARLRAAPR